MINFSLRGITAEELSFKANRIKLADPKFEIKPTFSRQVRKANENQNIYVIALDCKIESTEEAPKPFNLLVRYIGVFETDGVQTEEDRKAFAIKATEVLFPYLRQGVTALTTTAMLNPLVLPVVPGDILFPEDRPVQPEGNTGKQYTISFDESLLN